MDDFSDLFMSKEAYGEIRRVVSNESEEYILLEDKELLKERLKSIHAEVTLCSIFNQSFTNEHIVMIRMSVPFICEGVELKIINNYSSNIKWSYKFKMTWENESTPSNAGRWLLQSVMNMIMNNKDINYHDLQEKFSELPKLGHNEMLYTQK